MHEKYFGLIKEEMVMQRGDIQTVVERSGHRSIYLIFKENGVAHHHGFGVRTLDERGPGAEPHEWRHRPSIDDDLHVIAREGDLINTLLLVHLSFESGRLSIFAVSSAASTLTPIAAKIAAKRKSFFIGKNVGSG